MTIDPVTVTLATELRAEVEKMITDDPKMVGIARYLASVEIFWSTSIPTACAGNGFIFFNPEFYTKLPEDTRNTIMAHEVWHLILKHLARGIEFDPTDYNRAGDFVINIVLEDEGFSFDFGEVDFVPCKDPKYRGMSTEEVYNDIRKERKKKKEEPPKDTKKKEPSTDNDGDNPKPNDTDEDQDQNQDKDQDEDKNQDHVSRSVIEDLVKAAADTIAGNDDYNNVPNQISKDKKDLKDLTESLGEDTGYTHIELEITDRKTAIRGKTYEEIFADYLIDPISGAKRSFMRPNRRQHGMSDSNFRLPGRVKRKTKSNRLAHLIYALDVSGSITKETAQTFHDSVRTIKELLNPNLLTVLFFDTEIKLVKTFTDQQPYGKITVEAGGCTKLDAVYAYAANRKIDAMVIFTDLAVTILPEPKWHTIWLVPEHHREANVVDLYGDIHIIPKKQE